MADNKNTLCISAFNSPQINFARNEHRMCCRTKGIPITPEMLDTHGTKVFYQLDDLVKTKKDLLTGIRSPKCSYCWKVEDSGGVSPRSPYDQFVEFMAHTGWFGTKDYNIISDRLSNLSDDEANMLAKHLDFPHIIEIALTNTCDLKCVYCSSHFSTQWETEMIKYKEMRPRDITTPSPHLRDMFWKYFLESGFKATKFISFIGGEPLIINEFYDDINLILDKFSNYENQDELQPVVIINVITNLNSPPKYFKKLLDIIPVVLANKRLRLHIGISFESTGAKTEFIRSGTDWVRFSDNIHKLFGHVTLLPLDEKCRIELGIHATLNALSISSLPEFSRFVVSLQADYGIHIHLYNNQVINPARYNPAILTEDYAEYVDEAINIISSNSTSTPDMIDWIKWESYCTFLQGIKNSILLPDKDQDARKSFVKEIDKLCSRRNLDFHKTFPEMVDFYNMIKSS